MNGGGSKQTTTTNNAPWKSAQPVLETALNHANKEFMRDYRGAKTVFTDSTVIPWSQQTQQGMNLIQGNAAANSGGQGLSGQYQDVINQGGLNDQMAAASRIYGNVANGSGLTNSQQNALRGFGNIAGSGGYNDATRAASRAFQGAMNGSGLSSAQQEALNNSTGVMRAGGYNDAMRDAMGGYNKLQANPFDAYQSAALRNTQDLANSKFDLNANPAFQQVLQQAQSAARDSVNMGAGGAGRYGSGVHQGNLASEVGDLTSRMVGDEYRNWQGRRDVANQNLFNMGQTGVGTRLQASGAIGALGQQALGNQQNAQNMVNAIGQTAFQNRQNAASNLSSVGNNALNQATNAMGNMANIGQSGLSNRMNAGAGLAGLGQQGFSNLGNAYQGMQRPGQDMMQVGAMNEDLATRQMNDRLRIFNEKNNATWNQISRLNAIASGAGSLGGTQTQSQPGQNPWLTGAGYGLTGLGLLGGLF